ncbi:MAG TPA: AtpZ/AtpI family protein [Flavobacteriia bacterium]|jgi:F0F1-type ATP synthase assembly protein I|nr:AtpZ/AtpI family protein [Flavobacteriia bacterium]
MSKKQKKQLNKYTRFSGIAFQMVVTIGVGTYIGIKLDEKYPNKNNLFTVAFSLVFILLSLYSVIKQVTNISNKKDD